MVSTPEWFAYYSPVYPMTSTPVKKPHAWKSLCLFTNILDVKKLISVELELLNISASQLSIEINHGNWKKGKRGSKIDEWIKKSLYNWIMYCPQVVHSSVFHDCLKVKMYGHSEPQMVTKHLLHVSVKKPHNNLVSDAENCGLK